MGVSFDKVRERVKQAKAITWDGCHKIYVLMDDEQVSLMRSYGYDPLITNSTHTPDAMFELIEQWYEHSCGLRFVNAVTTNHANPNEGFEDLIAQFADAHEEEPEKGKAETTRGDGSEHQ
jgi:hypothetical protein